MDGRLITRYFPWGILPPALLFLVNLLWNTWGLAPVWMRSYANDLAAIPLMLWLALLVQRYLTFRNPQYCFRWVHIAFTVIYVSVVFEWWLPKTSASYTFDPWDMVCYAVGGVYFAIVLNRPT